MSPLTLVRNAAIRTREAMFPAFFPEAKHNHYRDFGFPVDLTFDQFYGIYRRNGMATAAVDKTILKTWQDNPFLQERQRDDGDDIKETRLEREIRQRFDDLRFWTILAEADRRSLVGCYAGVILRFADGKTFDQPVDWVNGGLNGLVEIVPAWEGQLTVSDWDMDETSVTYGKPKSYQFNEAQVENRTGQGRAFNLHPDRVIVWSKDGTVYGRSLLESGYNDLLTMEKIVGAGGEGFWKNAKSAPVFEVDKEARIADMAAAMGIEPSEIADRMNEQVEDWQKGFDRLLMIQGMQAKTLGVTLPDPEHFYGIALQSFAASIACPTKILVGMQTGERASSEDAEEWAQTNMSRRNGIVRPCIMDLVNRLERVGILPEKDWHLDWSDLTESSMGEKVDRANKMADTNQKMDRSGEIVFTHEEIRAVVGLEPLSEADKFRDEVDEDDALAAAGLDPADGVRTDT